MPARGRMQEQVTEGSGRPCKRGRIAPRDLRGTCTCELCSSARSITWKRRMLSDPRTLLLQSAKGRAKRTGVPFDLTLEDIRVPKFCPILGLELTPGSGKRSDSSPSLDRLRGSMGYVRGNVEVISLRANRIKNNASPRELAAIARWTALRSLPCPGGTSPTKTDYLINDVKPIFEWIHARSGLHRVDPQLGIARIKDSRIVAAFVYDHFQDSSCMLHTACDEPWGYNRELLRRAFAAPFEQWGYSCLLAAIETGNAKSRNLAMRLGFTEISALPGAHPSGALHFFVMYKKDCRWLKPLGRQ